MTFSCPSKSSIIPELLAPASNTRVTSEPFPPVAYEGSRFVLSCDVAKGSHLSYTWFFNRKEVTSSTSSFLYLTGNKLVMGKVTPQHAGYYSCMAWSRVQDTRRFSSSAEVQVMVKGMCQQKIQVISRLICRQQHYPLVVLPLLQHQSAARTTSTFLRGISARFWNQQKFTLHSAML